MKRFALAMPVALTRVGAGYRFQQVQQPRARLTRSEVADLLSKMVIVALFSSMAMRLARDAAATGHVTGMLLLASEALVVALTLVRRTAATVDRTWKARILTGLSTFGPPLVSPASFGFAPESLTIAISAIGLIIVVLGKLSIGRSFGLAPANRGIVSTGLYRFVRHPIYLGYLITHVGFALANAANWNLIVLAAADVALMMRAVCEERTLAGDDAYRAYMQRVRWRILPRVF
jgi:protein-S-isoprenylcysteine O-methyltransferase Ste14